MGEVIADRRFGADVEGLRKTGIEIRETDDFSDLVLPEPQYGEYILGELTADEKLLYAELNRTHTRLEKLGREYAARSLERLGSAVRTSDPSKSLIETFKNSEPQQYVFDSEQEKMEFYQLQHRHGVLHANFYWIIGERFGVHHWSCGVRSKFRAVKVKER